MSYFAKDKGFDKALREITRGRPCGEEEAQFWQTVLEVRRQDAAAARAAKAKADRSMRVAWVAIIAAFALIVLVSAASPYLSTY